jgi:hypothetical protein
MYVCTSQVSKYCISATIPKRKRSNERERRIHRQMDNINMHLRQMVFDDVEWTQATGAFM